MVQYTSQTSLVQADILPRRATRIRRAMRTRAARNWDTIAISACWRWLGVDLLMVDARDRLARRIDLARALLACEEEESDDDEWEEEQEEEDGNIDDD